MTEMERGRCETSSRSYEHIYEEIRHPSIATSEENATKRSSSNDYISMHSDRDAELASCADEIQRLRNRQNRLEVLVRKQTCLLKSVGSVIGFIDGAFDSMSRNDVKMTIKKLIELTDDYYDESYLVVYRRVDVFYGATYSNRTDAYPYIACCFSKRHLTSFEQQMRLTNPNFVKLLQYRLNKKLFDDYMKRVESFVNASYAGDGTCYFCLKNPDYCDESIMLAMMKRLYESFCTKKSMTLRAPAY